MPTTFAPLKTAMNPLPETKCRAWICESLRVLEPTPNSAVVIPGICGFRHGTEMSRLFHRLLYLLACATRRDLARQVQFLKTENEILRAKRSKRVTVSPQERRMLVRAGWNLVTAIKERISIVAPRTFFRWLADEKGAKEKPPPKSDVLIIA